MKTLLQWKAIRITYYERVCSLSHPGRKAHVPYFFCHLWPVWLYHIFPHYLINGTTIGKKVIKHKMCVLNISTAFFFSEIIRVLRKIARDIIHVRRSSCNVPVILVRH